MNKVPRDSRALRAVAIVLSFLFSPLVLYLLFFVSPLVITLINNDFWWLENLEWFITGAVLLVSAYGLKYIFRIARPSGYKKYKLASKYAMPSAYMVIPSYITAAFVWYLFIDYDFFGLVSALICLLALFTFGLIRLYLKASTWRDVLAGALLGVFWFVIIEFFNYLEWLPILYHSCQCGG